MSEIQHPLEIHGVKTCYQGINFSFSPPLHTWEVARYQATYDRQIIPAYHSVEKGKQSPNKVVERLGLRRGLRVRVVKIGLSLPRRRKCWLEMAVNCRPPSRVRCCLSHSLLDRTTMTHPWVPPINVPSESSNIPSQHFNTNSGTRASDQQKSGTVTKLQVLYSRVSEQ